MAFSEIYQSGVARSSELDDANLSVDLAILGSNEYWNLRDNRDASWYAETVSSDFVKAFSGQAIAFASLVEISPQYWSTGPSLDESDDIEAVKIVSTKIDSMEMVFSHGEMM